MRVVLLFVHNIHFALYQCHKKATMDWHRTQKTMALEQIYHRWQIILCAHSSQTKQYEWHQKQIMMALVHSSRTINESTCGSCQADHSLLAGDRSRAFTQQSSRFRPRMTLAWNKQTNDQKTVQDAEYGNGIGGQMIRLKSTHSNANNRLGHDRTILFPNCLAWS